jgi:hypothetical protein
MKEEIKREGKIDSTSTVLMRFHDPWQEEHKRLHALPWYKRFYELYLDPKGFKKPSVEEQAAYQKKIMEDRVAGRCAPDASDKLDTSFDRWKSLLVLGFIVALISWLFFLPR